jgi:hypothetical protein
VRASRLPILVIALAVATALTAAVLVPIGSTTPRTVWSAASGRPVPDRFTYLLFPRKAKVKLWRSETSDAGRCLDRAIPCTEHELHAGDSVGVWMDDEELQVPVGQLRYEPTGRWVDTLIANWKEQVASWGRETNWPCVDVTFENLPGHAHRVRLWRKSWEGDEDTFVYQVKENKVTPEAWLVIRSKARALGS